jgi:RNA polymerase sigma-70 factor (ECF subfamily)
MNVMKLDDHPDRSYRAGAGDAESMALAVRERLHPFVSHAIRDHHTTEDVLQDVLVVLIEQGHVLRHPGCFWPWVYRVAWSKVQDHFRDRARLRRVLDPDRSVSEATASDPLDGVEQRETFEQLAAALGQLSQHCRTVLYLRFHEQMPYAQIAALMHCTPGQIRIQLHRAKRQLRDHLLASCA